MPLLLTHHWIVQIRWRRLTHLTPTGRNRRALRRRVQRGGMVESVHRMGHHTTSYRHRNGSRPHQRRQ